ncbi:hypothetical protein TNCV_4497141 [Trichonephila clavipes]|nr:hypothetical protein TNCV_4497141 [Trichonephila clavipes]
MEETFSIASKALSGEIFLQRRKQVKVTWYKIGTICGGWCRCSLPRVAIWFCVAIAECSLALSSNNRTPDLRNKGRFFGIASFNFYRVLQCQVALMVPSSKK